MNAVFILISLVMVQVSQMEDSKSQVKVVPDSGGGGASIVKSLEREIREAKQGKDKNSKYKEEKRPKKRTKNKGKKKVKGKNSKKVKQDKRKNGKSKGRKPSKTQIKNKGKNKKDKKANKHRKKIKNKSNTAGKGKNSKKEKQDKRKNVKSKGRKPSKTGRNNKGKNKKDKKASKYKKKIRNKKIEKSNTAGKGKNSKKQKQVKKGKKSMNVKSKGEKTAKNEMKHKGKKMKGKKANKVKKGNRKKAKGTNKKNDQKGKSKKGQKDRKKGTKIKGKANNKLKVKSVNVKKGKQIINDCTCPLEVQLTPIKKYTKNRNSLANLKRISVWWKLLKSKQDKARTTFNITSEAISQATFNGTICRGGPVPPAAETAFKVLKTCNKTAVFKCDREGINMTKISTDCNQSPSCSAECKDPVCDDNKCAGRFTAAYKKASCATATCTSNCTTTSRLYNLTDEMVAFINSTCIPELEAWTARYRACTSKTTYSDCSITCETDQNKFQCQKDACQSCGADCTFDDCLSANYNNASALTACQCACYNSLDTDFPISKAKVGGLDCFGLVKFERRVKQRRDRCLSQTALSGNFVDCRQQERTSIFWIYFCRDFNCNCDGITTRAPSTSSRNRFLAELKNFHLQKRSVWKN